MSALTLIEAVQSGDCDVVKARLQEGAKVNQTDEYGWTALHWAAGKGNTEIIELLLNAGANVAHKGRDDRTPYQIALAAARLESALLLQQAQQNTELVIGTHPYCKAYPITAMREFAEWSSEATIDDNAIVYLHDDLTVTACIWRHEAVLFQSRTSDWQQFCTEQLAFSAPTDLSLVEAVQ